MREFSCIYAMLKHCAGYNPFDISARQAPGNRIAAYPEHAGARTVQACGRTVRQMAKARALQMRRPAEECMLKRAHIVSFDGYRSMAEFRTAFAKRRPLG